MTTNSKGSAESVGAELLPCPFCGSVATWFKTGRDIGIECGNEPECPGNAQTDTYDPEHRQIAVDQWNTRARPSAAGRAEPTCAEIAPGCIGFTNGCHCPSCMGSARAEPAMEPVADRWPTMPKFSDYVDIDSLPDDPPKAGRADGGERDGLIADLESLYTFWDEKPLPGVRDIIDRAKQAIEARDRMIAEERRSRDADAICYDSLRAQLEQAEADAARKVTAWERTNAELEDKLTEAQFDLRATQADAARKGKALAAIIGYADARNRRHGVEPGGSPGHAHSRPGIWDDDNGVLAGATCDECAAWDRARDALKPATGRAE